MHDNEAAIQIAYDLLYVGPHAFTQTYDPTILPLCEVALINASATARLAGGLETVDDIHARKQMKPALLCAIRNLRIR